MVFLNKKTNLSIFLIFFISACQIDSNVNLGDDLQKQVIDENIVFEKYLSNQWEQNLKDRPIFASLLSNKSFNQDITSNSIQEFVKNKAKLQKDLINLNRFNYEKLNISKIIGFTTGFIGLFVLLFNNLDVNIYNNFISKLAVVLGAFFYALNALLVKKIKNVHVVPLSDESSISIIFLFFIAVLVTLNFSFTPKLLIFCVGSINVLPT